MLMANINGVSLSSCFFTAPRRTAFVTLKASAGFQFPTTHTSRQPTQSTNSLHTKRPTPREDNHSRFVGARRRSTTSISPKLRSDRKRKYTIGTGRRREFRPYRGKSPSTDARSSKCSRTANSSGFLFQDATCRMHRC